MAEVPSFFNANQFFEILLPGYLAVILLLFLFFPTFLPTNQQVGFGFDFLSAVIFLVAGPVIGVVLYQAQSCFLYFKNYFSSNIFKGMKNTYLRKYYKLRLRMTDDEKKELETIEARYFFCTSSSIVLFGVTILHLAKVLINGQEIVWFIDIPMIIAGTIFVLGGQVLMRQEITPLFYELHSKYNI